MKRRIHYRQNKHNVHNGMHICKVYVYTMYTHTSTHNSRVTRWCTVCTYPPGCPGGHGRLRCQPPHSSRGVSLGTNCWTCYHAMTSHAALPATYMHADTHTHVRTHMHNVYVVQCSLYKFTTTYCMYVHTHTQTHTVRQMDTQTCTQSIHAVTHTCTHAHTYVRMRTHTHAYLKVLTQIHYHSKYM